MSALRAAVIERALGWVADDVPVAVGFRDLCVVAEQAREQALTQRRVVVGIDGFPVAPVGAEGGVTGPRNLERCAAGVDGLHGHLVLGERARLVRADDGGASEGLDRGEVSDDRVVAGHAVHPDRKGDRDRGREAFGDRADRQRDRGVDHLVPGFTASDPDHEGDGREPEDRERQDPAELGDLAGEGCFDTGGRADQPVDLAHFRFRARAGRDALSSTGDDQRSRVGHVVAIGQRGFDRQLDR